MGGRMLKVAIVGCGNIADDHCSQIQRIEGCEIVGVCDREPLMARQLSERFPVKRILATWPRCWAKPSLTLFMFALHLKVILGLPKNV